MRTGDVIIAVDAAKRDKILPNFIYNIYNHMNDELNCFLYKLKIPLLLLKKN